MPSPIADLRGAGLLVRGAAAHGAALVGDGRARQARALVARGAGAEARASTATSGDGRGGFYGLALDPQKRLLRVVTSNVGHCLATGIVARDRVPR